MIRVLDVITTPQGGRRLLTHRVAEIDRDPEFEDFLVCPAEDYFTRAFAELGIKHIPLEMGREIEARAVPGELRSMLRLLREHKPDIVHSHTSKAGAIARIACWIHNRRARTRTISIYQVHSFGFNGFSGLKRAVYLGLEVFLSGLTDIVLFQNALELAQAKSHGMGRRARLRYIGNGINFADFKPPAGPRPRPASWKLVCVARVEAKKNHRMLIRAVELLRGRYGHSELELFCVGEVNDRSALEEAARLGLEGAVHFTGVKTKDEVAGYLSSCQVSVLSSVAEGLPRGLMESMLFGLPCVATDVPGSSEVVADGEDGFLVPLGDHEAMAERIDRLIREDGLYERLSRQAMDKARSRFDEDRVIGELKGIYREAVRGRS